MMRPMLALAFSPGRPFRPSGLLEPLRHASARFFLRDLLPCVGLGDSPFN
jgi:hypothetical protein